MGPGGPVLRLLLVLGLLSPIVELDLTVQRAVQRMRHPALEPMMHAASDVGRPSIVLGALLGIAVFTGPAGPATARIGLFTAAATNATVELLKRATDRARPDGEQRRSNASFPSGHAATAFALALVLARRWRRLAPAFWGFAGLVAWSRIYLNRHFLSDVVCGAIIGLAIAELISRAAARWDRRARPARRSAGRSG